MKEFVTVSTVGSRNSSANTNRATAKEEKNDAPASASPRVSARRQRR